MLLIGALVAAVVSSVRRLMRARGVERPQLKWFAYAGTLLAVTLPLSAAFWYRSSVVQVLIGVALNAMPLAVGVAFAPVDGETRFSMEGETDAHGFFKLAEPVFARMARREWATSRSLLKDVLEASDSRNDFRTEGP